MLKNQNIICISSIDWDFVWQGHQEIMSTFVKNDNRILFIENTGIRFPRLRDVNRIKKRFINWLKGIKGFREEKRNLFIHSPIILPFPYSRIARMINKNFLFGSLRKWLQLMDFKDAIIWTFLPTGTALDIIDELDYKCLVYYCIADFNELVRNARKVRRTEDVLIKKSDIIFAQGKVLEEKCRRFNNNVHIFPFGVNINIFDTTKNYLTGYNYDDIKSIKKPIIGYIGGIHRHLDFDLLTFAAKNKPEWSIVLIGPIQTDISYLKEISNIIFLDKKDFYLLPGYIREFDICIIPYLKSKFTKTVYPTKLNEYHALGKPVISTDLPEVIAFNEDNGNLILIARTKEEFVKKIQDALDKQDNNSIRQRIESAKRHSWDIKIEEMSELIEETIEKKELLGYSDWQMRFREIYRIARRKFIKVVLSASMLWLLVFYTPILWWAAEPLKIIDPPQKADVIVVFAGGVGESGQSGQGYEERLEHAIELYRKGFSNKLIFSSGAVGTFSEPYVMKALALSLGVPEEAIVLEDKAASTYQNVKFTLSILNEKGYDKILLVGSPYHMRRASLVFKKLAPDKQVIFSPVPKSTFYSNEIFNEKGRRIWKRINLKQIKGIIHEYLGIFYSWWKGYI